MLYKKLPDHFKYHGILKHFCFSKLVNEVLNTKVVDIKLWPKLSFVRVVKHILPHIWKNGEKL